jgi:signal transduction histidine kinase
MLVNRLLYSNSINQKSTKILTFVVSDILDLSQIKNGKFRSVISKFDVKKAVLEIKSILDFKADMGGITVFTTF